MSTSQHMPTSPIAHHNDFSYHSPTEEPFDNSSFSFLNTDTTMDFYIGTPEPSAHDENPNMPRAIPINANPSLHTRHQEQGDQHEDMPMGPAEGDMSQLHIGDQDNPHTSGSPLNEHHNVYPFNYAPYHMQYAQTPPIESNPSNFYHPYRSYGNTVRSPRFHHPLPEPLSPPLSLSPPGSSSSRHHQALINTPPAAISPQMVSPASAIGILSDTSPPTFGWSYPLPHIPSQAPIYATTPLNNIANLPQTSPTGLSMVVGFPYPTSSPTTTTPIRGSSTRVVRPKATRKNTSSSTVKKEKDDDDIDSDLESTRDHSSRGGLGLSPDNIEARIPVGAKREDVRKARIESEQRRRDELREGFKRLKEALPATNQRSSKSSLLDRSVAHIEQIEGANHYLMAQLDATQAELMALRATNQELVRAVASHSRASSGSSPRSGSSGGRI